MLNNNHAELKINDSLTVVIIAKNEEDYIGKCIEYIIYSTRNIIKKDIILIDSNSTDDTIRIAKKFNIRIFQLRKNWVHTPAAGRYIGFNQTDSEYILFIDGDSYLMDGFLERAINYFKADNRIAAITGKRKDIWYQDGKAIRIIEDMTEIGNNINRNKYLRGTSIFKSNVLKMVGNYNPYLFSEEEAELSERILKNGYDIIEIPYDMIIHNTVPTEYTLKSYYGRIKRNLHLGPGQILRYSLSNYMKSNSKISRKFIKRLISGIEYLLWICLGFLTLIITILFKVSFNMLYIYMVLSLLIFIFYCIKLRSTFKALEKISMGILSAYYLVIGFLEKPKDPNKYPTDAIRIV